MDGIKIIRFKFFLLFLMPLFAFAKETKNEQCETSWSDLSVDHYQSAIDGDDAFLNKWKQNAGICTDLIFYQSRLSLLYSLHGEPAKASDAIKKIGKPSNSQTPYAYLLDLAKIQMEIAEAQKGKLTKEFLLKMEMKYQEHLAKFPQSEEGAAMLGTMQRLLGKNADAISTLEPLTNSNNLNLYGVYVNLTISYSAIGSYQKAIDTGNKAYAINQAVTSDQYFAYAVAKADAAVGKLKAAETILRVIATKKPEVRQDPEFQDAVIFVSNKMKEADGGK